MAFHYNYKFKNFKLLIKIICYNLIYYKHLNNQLLKNRHKFNEKPYTKTIPKEVFFYTYQFTLKTIYLNSAMISNQHTVIIWNGSMVEPVYNYNIWQYDLQSSYSCTVIWQYKLYTTIHLYCDFTVWFYKQHTVIIYDSMNLQQSYSCIVIRRMVE